MSKTTISDQNSNGHSSNNSDNQHHQQQHHTSSHMQQCQKKQHRLYEYYEEQKIKHTSKVLNNNDSFLNCLQFINLIQYYFNDSPTFRLNDQHISEQSSMHSKFGIMPFKSSSEENCDINQKTASDMSRIQTCYPCIVCSSQFSFEQTFHLHLERRSILIRFISPFFITSCWTHF